MLIRKLLIIGLLTAIMAMPVLAQEASTESQSTEQSASGPSSSTTAVLLIGIAAILAVGGYVIRRERAHQEVD